MLVPRRRRGRSRPRRNRLIFDALIADKDFDSNAIIYVGPNSEVTAEDRAEVERALARPGVLAFGFIFC